MEEAAKQQQQQKRGDRLAENKEEKRKPTQCDCCFKTCAEYYLHNNQRFCEMCLAVLEIPLKDVQKEGCYENPWHPKKDPTTAKHPQGPNVDPWKTHKNLNAVQVCVQMLQEANEMIRRIQELQKGILRTYVNDETILPFAPRNCFVAILDVLQVGFSRVSDTLRKNYTTLDLMAQDENDYILSTQSEEKKQLQFQTMKTFYDKNATSLRQAYPTIQFSIPQALSNMAVPFSPIHQNGVTLQSVSSSSSPISNPPSSMDQSQGWPPLPEHYDTKRFDRLQREKEEESLLSKQHSTDTAKATAPDAEPSIQVVESVTTYDTGGEMVASMTTIETSATISNVSKPTPQYPSFQIVETKKEPSDPRTYYQYKDHEGKDEKKEKTPEGKKQDKDHKEKEKLQEEKKNIVYEEKDEEVPKEIKICGSCHTRIPDSDPCIKQDYYYYCIPCTEKENLWTRRPEHGIRLGQDIHTTASWVQSSWPKTSLPTKEEEKEKEEALKQPSLQAPRAIPIDRNERKNTQTSSIQERLEQIDHIQYMVQHMEQKIKDLKNQAGDLECKLMKPTNQTFLYPLRNPIVDIITNCSLVESHLGVMDDMCQGLKTSPRAILDACRDEQD